MVNDYSFLNGRSSELLCSYEMLLHFQLVAVSNGYDVKLHWLVRFTWGSRLTYLVVVAEVSKSHLKSSLIKFGLKVLLIGIFYEATSKTKFDKSSKSKSFNERTRIGFSSLSQKESDPQWMFKWLESKLLYLRRDARVPLMSCPSHQCPLSEQARWCLVGCILFLVRSGWTLYIQKCRTEEFRIHGWLGKPQIAGSDRCKGWCNQKQGRILRWSLNLRSSRTNEVYLLQNQIVP